MSNLIKISEFRGTQATAIAVLEPKAKYAELVPKDEWILDFSKAREICNQVDGLEDYSLLPKKSSRVIAAAVGMAVRSKSFEELLTKYIGQSQNPVVVQFGCGLSDRSERYKTNIDAGLPFYDVDFPDMIAFRRNFYQDSDNYKMIASDLSNYTWIDDIAQEHRNGQFIFVAEGVSPYLTEEQLKELFATLTEHFPGSHLIFDTYTELKLKGTQKQMKKFGVKFAFYNNDPVEIIAWGKGGEYKLVEEDNLLYRDDFLNSPHLGGFFKLVMKMFAKWFKWNKDIIRSTVVMVFRLG